MISNKAPKFAIIAAIEETTRAMGKNNRLLWQLEGDLPRFKKLTEGQVVIMGRNTYESIGRPLPDRHNIIVSKTIGGVPGAAVAHSFENAVTFAKSLETEKIFFIGGVAIYLAALPMVDIIHLTLVEDPQVEADTFFPPYDNFFMAYIGEMHNKHHPPFRYADFVKKPRS